VVGNSSVGVVFEKHKQNEVFDVMKRYFNDVDYYFTATNAPVGVVQPLWLKDVKKVVGIC